MHGFVDNIEQLTTSNTNFRHVIYTSAHSQIVLMNLNPSEDIGEEIHDVDQFFRLESGEADFVINSVSHHCTDGFAVLVPAGAKHNVINTSSTQPLKLYTIYSPPHHQDQVVHATKQQAESDSEHFTGQTSE